MLSYMCDLSVRAEEDMKGDGSEEIDRGSRERKRRASRDGQIREFVGTKTDKERETIKKMGILEKEDGKVF